MSPSTTFLSFALLSVVALAHSDITISPRLPRHEVGVYKPEDISYISLYGSTAVYKPQHCPRKIKFVNRARLLPELAIDKIGILPSDIIVNGERCKSDALMIDFAPLATTEHYPPQWVFEDSSFSGHPMNFTCGDHSFSIRYGYFNDVSTKYTNGLLDRSVVYFDFAVIPNSNPFTFCSYSARRTDGQRPLAVAPFPTRETWDAFTAARSDILSPSEDPPEEDKEEEEEELDPAASVEEVELLPVPIDPTPTPSSPSPSPVQKQAPRSNPKWWPSEHGPTSKIELVQNVE